MPCSYPESSRLRNQDSILAARDKLSRLAEKHALPPLLQHLLDEAEKLTDSRIGFICVLDENGDDIHYQTWSSNTLRNHCHNNANMQHARVSKAGIWAQCVDLKKPVVHNDFNSLKNLTQLAHGHPPLFRELLVPVVRSHKTIAVIGVGNKPEHYRQQDIDIVAGLADLCWDLIARKQAEEKLLKHTRQQSAVSPHASPQQDKYRLLFEHLSEPVLLLEYDQEQQLRIADANSAACRHYAYPREQLLTLTEKDLLAPGQTPLAELLAQQPMQSCEAVHCDRHGHSFPIVYHISTSDADGPDRLLITVHDISKQKQAAQTLSRSEELFRIITENISDVVWILDPHQEKYTYFSPSVARMRGHTAAEAMQMTMEETLTPDSCRKARQRIGYLQQHPQAEGRDLESIELQQYHKDGSIIDIEILARPLRDENDQLLAMVGVTRDVTERKKAERNLQIEREKFRSLFEHARDYVIIMQPHGQDMIIRDLSMSACLYHGYSKEELIGQSISRIDPNGFDVARFLADLKENKNGEEISFESIHMRKDGSTFPVESHIQLIEVAGEYYLFAIEKDLTERKKAEQEQRTLENQLRQKYKMESIGLMAGGIAHNFNNNLAIILGNLELLRIKAQADPGLNKFIENASIGIQRSRELVQQIMTYSRQDTQLKHIVKPDMVFEEAIELLRSTLPEGVVLNYIPLAQDDLHIQADPSRLQEILFRLYNNSVYAMQNKGRLDISLCAAHISASDIPAQYNCRPGAYLCLAVADNGCGITPELMDKIFDPFFTTKEVGEGTGMGLSTVQGIVKQHEGMIKVYSHLNQGTRFELYFPLLSGNSGRHKPSKPLPPVRILLLDEDAVLAQLHCDMLGDAGYQAEAVTKGAAALQRLSQQPGEFSLLICNLEAADPKGRQFIESIRDHDRGLAIIVCSSYSQHLGKHQLQTLGINAQCLKPLDITELLTIVRKVLT